MNFYENHYGATFSVNGTEYHTFSDFGLYPKEQPKIPAAEVRTDYIEIPGAHGSIDMTEALTGFPIYDNRKGTFRYTVLDRAAWLSKFAAVKQALHGRVCNIVLDEEPGGYYHGRVSVDELKSSKTTGEIVITAVLDPFWYVRENPYLGNWLWDTFRFDTDVVRDYSSIAISGETEVSIVSTILGGHPMFYADSAMTLETADGDTYSIPAETETVLDGIDLPRAEEEVTWTVTGSGTLGIYIPVGRL